MSDNKLVILNETFGKEGSDEKMEGLTIIIDGKIKTAFDMIKARRGYEHSHEVLSDIIFAGIEKILTEK